VDQGITAGVRSAQTQQVPDVHRDADYVPGNPTSRSELAVPLRRGERILGCSMWKASDWLRLMPTMSDGRIPGRSHRSGPGQRRLYTAVQQELAERRRAEEALRIAKCVTAACSMAHRWGFPQHASGPFLDVNPA